MKKLIIFFGVLLFSANLISVNFFSQKNKVDVLFSLDSKFNGKVIEVKKNEFLITDIFSFKSYEKKFNNFFIKEIQISPAEKGTLIKLFITDKYKTSVALTPDGYGLRFRIEDEVKNVKSNENLTFSPHQKELDYVTYLISIAILFVLALILYFFRKKLNTKLPTKSNLNILFQKPLDTKNRVALIEFNNRKYLVIVGNSNILLDVFDENMINISTQNNFEEYLKSNQEISKKLDTFRDYIENAEKLKEIDERI